MAYIRSEQVKEFREEIKKAFPKDFKFSIVNRDNSQVCVSLIKSPLTFGELFDIEEEIKKRTWLEMPFCDQDWDKAHEKAVNAIEIMKVKFESGEFSCGINQYHLDQYSGKAGEVFRKVDEIVNKGNHDNSDSMTDYFDVGWYTDYSIGKFDKGYQCVNV